MIEYQGHRFEGYNKPRRSWLKGKKMVVLAKVGSTIKLIHFGDSTMQDYRQHKDKTRRANYLKRSAGIRDGHGKLTKDNPLSSNYWSRRILW